MRFRILYEIAEALKGPPIGFDYLRQQIIDHHAEIGRVDVFSVDYPQPNGQAHYRLGETDRTSAYEEEFLVAEIRHCHTLAADQNEYRYSLTKELMHVFDPPNARVDSREKFVQLLRDIQNKPLPEHVSPMFASELDARWMACLVLCPKKFRDVFLADYRAKRIQNVDIAETFLIPEWVVPFIMDDYYETAHGIFLNR